MPVLDRDEAKFELEVPVVVAGAGACGLVAALAAHDANSRAVVIERDAAPMGSSAMSLGALCAAGSSEQRRNDVDDNAERFVADILAKTRGQADPELARMVADASGATVDWLAEAHGVEFKLDPNWPPAFGHTARRMHVTAGGSGADMMARLIAAVERTETEILCNALLTDVFWDGQRIAGVRYRRPDGHSEDVACGALVLATCGFAANQAMVASHIPSMTKARYFGWEGNDGSGMLLGAELGGRLVDMDAYQGLGLLAEPQGIDLNPRFLIEGGIQVNRHGARFSNEVDDVSGQGARVIEQPGHVAWVVFDQQIHLNCYDLPQYRLLRELNGVMQAASLEELAACAGIDAGGLTASVKDIVPEVSDRWGRVGSPRRLTAPFFAVRVTGAIFHTQGGLDIGTGARVRRLDGSLMQNLHAGGGAARGISGHGPSGYLPGAGLCAAITLGALAGRAASLSTNGISASRY